MIERCTSAKWYPSGFEFGVWLHRTLGAFEDSEDIREQQSWSIGDTGSFV